MNRKNIIIVMTAALAASVAFAAAPRNANSADHDTAGTTAAIAKANAVTTTLSLCILFI